MRLPPRSAVFLVSVRRISDGEGAPAVARLEHDPSKASEDPSNRHKPSGEWPPLRKMNLKIY